MVNSYRSLRRRFGRRRRAKRSVSSGQSLMWLAVQKTLSSGIPGIDKGLRTLPDPLRKVFRAQKTAPVYHNFRTND